MFAMDGDMARRLSIAITTDHLVGGTILTIAVLHLFNRRTILAGSDLQLPSLAWGVISAGQQLLFLQYLI